MQAAAKAVPQVSLKTIVQLQTPQDLQYVLKANELVTETFYSISDNPVFDAVNFNSYRMRSAAQTLGLHMGLDRSHATILALPSTKQSAATHQHHAHVFQRQVPTAKLRGRDASGEQPAVGVVNVTLMQASSSIAAATDCKVGTPFAMITNMAVSPAVRRQGVAHQLMRAALRTAILDMACSPPFAMLLAYKYYQPAIKLYESWGFSNTPWEDPLWLADAEKGKLGRQRRIMMAKRLSGPGLTELLLSSDS
eukprot:gene8576-8758_t